MKKIHGDKTSKINASNISAYTRLDTFSFNSIRMKANHPQSIPFSSFEPSYLARISADLLARKMLSPSSKRK
jgi:hypothetical protein